MARYAENPPSALLHAGAAEALLLAAAPLDGPERPASQPSRPRPARQVRKPRPGAAKALLLASEPLGPERGERHHGSPEASPPRPAPDARKPVTAPSPA